MHSLCGHRVDGCIKPPARGSLRLGLPHTRHSRLPKQRSSGLAALQQQSGATNDAEAQDKKLAAVSLAISIGGGCLLSQFGIGMDEALPEWSRQLSSALGWSYVLAWSISFYPQVIQNAQRKSVTGLSADYLVYSMLGYAAYAAYTAALHFNPGVQAAYMAAHAGSPPDVQLTDFLFAGHALLVTMYTIYQCVLYGGSSSSGSSDGSSDGSSLQTSRVTNLTTAAVFAAVVAYSGHIGSTCGLDDCDAWLPMLYLLGAVKVSMTLIKYTPQALLNAQRCSTEGWSINNVLLDLAGGMLSFGQVGLNAFARGDLSVITGNPAKLAISLLSIGFDIIFIMQHYVLYPSSSSSSKGEGSTELSNSAESSRSSSSNSNRRQPLRRLASVAVRAANGKRQQ